MAGNPWSSRLTSLSCVSPPNRTRAARLAASGVIPCRTCSSVSISRCVPSSRSNSSSPSPGDNHARMRVPTPLIASNLGLSSLRDAQHAADDAGHTLPIPRFRMELLPPGFRDAVEPGLPVVVRRAPGGRDPALLHQAHERGVDGALMDLQGIFADLFDAAGDAVAVQR